MLQRLEHLILFSNVYFFAHIPFAICDMAIWQFSGIYLYTLNYICMFVSGWTGFHRGQNPKVKPRLIQSNLLSILTGSITIQIPYVSALHTTPHNVAAINQADAKSKPESIPARHQTVYHRATGLSVVRRVLPTHRNVLCWRGKSSRRNSPSAERCQ